MIVNAQSILAKAMNNNNIDPIRIADNCCYTADMVSGLITNPLQRGLVAKLLLYQYVEAYNQAILDSGSANCLFTFEQQRKAEAHIENHFNTKKHEQE